MRWMAASSRRRNDLLAKALGLVFAVLWALGFKSSQIFFMIVRAQITIIVIQ